ncbi:hypothetical protein FA95DRAFT_1582445 [Auriscalpium vulgare]|uniref:Uncharacterized protein n=1 Tax=Auriscalpium vulgare TaxID=40419 RepID=A0ACB8RUN4_9AGAM|nr:hypothetical protein FA95DRAFT_1582445 [Auriscalpium vulgare]
MASKSKSKQEEALQILDDLDMLSPEAAVSAGVNTSAAVPPTANPGEAADVLAFLDEITQKSSEPTRATTAHLDRPLSRAGTPNLRKSTERVKVGGPSLLASGSSSAKGTSPSASSSSLAAPTNQEATPQADSSQVQGSGGWGWGSVWSTASSALQQAKSVVDEQVKNLPKQEQALKWREGVLEYAKTAQLDKLTLTHLAGQDFRRVGLSTLTDILNAVAPPISEHEVIQVWLSHDMKGYEGVERLVYSALARILEQVEGGDLIVNRGEESKPKDVPSDVKREMNAVDELEPALKLAQIGRLLPGHKANLEELIKTNPAPDPTEPSSTQNPTTTSYVYIRIQPFTTSFTIPGPSPTVSAHLQFIIHLSDPTHQLVHTTVTQAVPGKWLKIWDDYDWVEDLVAEALRVGVEVVGQEYIVARMGWAKEKDDEEQTESFAHVSASDA